jgi:hypothetical protein
MEPCGASLALAARGEAPASHRGRRGAPLARRDDREYREYLREEQRRPRGCIAGRMQLAFHHGLLAVDEAVGRGGSGVESRCHCRCDVFCWGTMTGWFDRRSDSGCAATTAGARLQGGR